MTYLKALEYIHSLNVFGSKPGLSRIKKLLSLLGNPQRELSCVHIAGTNGKGSTATMIATALKLSGKKVGLYTSPYIVDFRERIQINNNYIGKKDLSVLTNLVKQKAESMDEQVTEFEFITALMFLYFKINKVDVAVIEVGLGGRFDATNVITPLLSVITKISLDHTAVLGNTYEKIAFEKSGIIKPNIPVVVAPNQYKKALSKIEEIAKSNNSNCLVATLTEHKNLKLFGSYQQENASTAKLALEVLGVDEKIITKGIKQAFIPARYEKICDGVFLDGAHNPDGAKVLAQQFKGNPVLIMGMMKDKDIDKVLKILTNKAKKVITVTVLDNPRAITAQELNKMVLKYKPSVIAKDYQEALVLALKAKENDDIIICGSLYLASQIRSLAKDFFNSTTN